MAEATFSIPTDEGSMDFAVSDDPNNFYVAVTVFGHHGLVIRDRDAVTKLGQFLQSVGLEDAP